MKYAVVTGGTSRIGFCIAKMLISKGYYISSTFIGNQPDVSLKNYESIRTGQTSRLDVYEFITHII